MIPRSLRVAYTIPPIVAVVLAFLALLQLDQQGVLGASFGLTVTEGTHPQSNGRVAAAVERAAEESGATLTRTVADRTDPATARALLTTRESGSLGAAWTDQGYQDFDRSMTTTVRPMSRLDRYDVLAVYEVHGTAADARMFAAAFARTGYDATTAPIRGTGELALQQGASTTLGLVAVTALACAVLCLAGTLGVPRRAALRSLAGRSILRNAAAELMTAGTTLVIGAALAVPTVVALACYNGGAQLSAFAGIAVLFWALLLLPVIVAHASGALLASRMRLPAALRGARPAGFVVRVAQLARLPAAFLLVAAVFGCVGSASVERAGASRDELRAAGDAVQLGITPDPRPGQTTQAYWDRIGAMARAAMISGDAFLAATGDISARDSERPYTAFFVDAGYLRSHELDAADGERITGVAADTIEIWVPPSLVDDRAEIVDILRGWDLREANPPLIQAVRSGSLAPDQRMYAFPDDSKPTAWLRSSAIVVLPPGAQVFTDDMLSAWVSTGDVVFRNEAAALRVIHEHGLDREFSTVVPVGQAAAERARAAAVAARIDAITAIAAFGVVVLVLTLAAVAHRRRFGDVVFTRHVAGWSFLRANSLVLVVEGAIVASAVIVAINDWWSRRPDVSGRNSALDPIAQSAPTALFAAMLVTVVAAAVSIVALAITGRRAVRDHGEGT